MATAPTVATLRARLEGVPIADRHRLDRRLRGLGRLSGRRAQEVRAQIADDIDAAERRLDERRRCVPATIGYPEDLPIVESRDVLLETIRENQVVVVAGETGSGKSTQLPKLCLELGRGVAGLIGHTQPRRIAARSIAERLAEELQTTVGDTVGYTVRFTDQVGDRTLIKVMTDGILLNELQRDRSLRGYDTIIIDEAHERSLNIDFLLGYLKGVLPQRPDLKLIITSATIDTERFSAHFDDAPIVEVSGRTYPVEVRYRPLVGTDDAEARDQTDGIVDAVLELRDAGPGDILVFCSGEREIRDAAEALRGLELPHTEVLPLFGRLSAGEQHRVFARHSGRRIVVATNVAETSLTVPGIRYVVDAGTARISRFSRRTKVQRLPIEAISQASANQRAGRCGRLGPGVCIRLYSAEDLMSRPEFTEPEVLRTNLASVILQMAAIGLGTIESFPFIEPPDTRTIRDGIALLRELGAVEGEREGSKDWLTDVGRKLARLPLDPRLGRMMLAADGEACLREMLIITSALSIIDPRERPTGKEEHARQLHLRFRDETSDFLSILNLWRYLEKERRARTSSQFRKMCRDEFLNWRRVREWQDIYSQLRRVADDLGLKANREAARPEAVHRALLAGLLSHVGVKDPDGFEYRGARGARFAINPGSALFKKAPQWVMAAELVETTRLWARVVAGVDPAAIEELGAHLVNRSQSDPWWDAERGAAVARQTVTLYGVPLVADRVVLYHRFDAAMARELFIRHALVLGEWATHFGFLARNAAKVEEIRRLEARARRADMLVDEDAMVRFYAARIPQDIVSVRHFERWWNENREAHPGLLDMTTDHLIAFDAAGVDDDLFPASWHYGDIDLALSYEFDPASADDGVTIEIPAKFLDRIEPAVFEWNVPGFRDELIEALIKSLPKRLRKMFAPVPDTAREVAAAIRPEEDGIVEALRRELSRRAAVTIFPEDFEPAAVANHLRPRFRIVDDSGNVIAKGDDLGEIRNAVREDARATTSASSHPIEQEGITGWDFGELPPEITLQGAGHDVVAYPALVDDGDTVSIRLVSSRREQIELTWDGTRRLLLLQLPNPTKLLRLILNNELRLTLSSSPYTGTDEWMDDCVACSLDQVMVDAGGLVWNPGDFERLLLAARDHLAEVLERVGKDSEAILRELHEVETLLAAARGDAMQTAAGDVADQIGRFIYSGFLAGVGADRLDDLRRYLAAASYRLRKLPDNPQRDYEQMTRVRILEDELDALMDSLPWSPRMVEISWMLQELRVSFFAQPIGAKGPVSEKRVRRALQELLAPD
jgi:ATP-dependent helicase HrpA